MYIFSRWEFYQSTIQSPQCKKENKLHFNVIQKWPSFYNVNVQFCDTQTLFCLCALTRQSYYMPVLHPLYSIQSHPITNKRFPKNSSYISSENYMLKHTFKRHIHNFSTCWVNTIQKYIECHRENLQNFVFYAISFSRCLC